MKKRIIAIDFDGTCVDHRFPAIGSDVPNAVDVIKLLEKDSHLILWTIRSEPTLTDAICWFVRNNIELFGINKNPNQHTWSSSPKAYAQIYIDDAAFGCPLITVPGFNRPVVDWLKIKEILCQY